MSVYATAANADAIVHALERADAKIREAERDLKDAFILADADYDHNSDQLRHLGGGIRLISSAVTLELYAWIGYARARKQAEDRIKTFDSM